MKTTLYFPKVIRTFSNLFLNCSNRVKLIEDKTLFDFFTSRRVLFSACFEDRNVEY